MDFGVVKNGENDFFNIIVKSDMSWKTCILRLLYL